MFTFRFEFEFSILSQVSFMILSLPIYFALNANQTHANIPAAYLACEDATPGEECVMTGPQYGACVLDTLCTDPEETTVNECLLCVDACWNGEEGDLCIRPWTGEEGECELQDQCTDRPETSFLECMRCVKLKPKSEEFRESDQGCIQKTESSWSILVRGLLLLLPFWLIRKFAHFFA